MDKNSEFVSRYYRDAKLAESRLLVAALQRDAGEIDDSQLSVAACQYASAVTNWRLAREAHINSKAGSN